MNIDELTNLPVDTELWYDGTDLGVFAFAGYCKYTGDHNETDAIVSFDQNKRKFLQMVSVENLHMKVT
jgi:hypothetical protein